MTTTYEPIVDFKLNSRNARRLIARLKNLGPEDAEFNMRDGFYMSPFGGFEMEKIAQHEKSGNWCGTQACIGGHAAILAYQDDPARYKDYVTACAAGAVWLGMDPSEDAGDHPIFEPLFYHWKDEEGRSPKAAIIKLEVLIDEYGDGNVERCTDEEWERLNEPA